MMMSQTLSSQTESRVQWLLEQMQTHNGLAPVDIEKFWEADAKAKRDSFASDCPQVPCGVMMSTEAVWDELGIEENWQRQNDDTAYRVDLNRQYNDLSEKIVGKRLLNESLPEPSRQYPKVKKLSDIFEAKEEWHIWSYWLKQSADTPDELEALLDRVERRLENLRACVLPENWETEKERLMAMGIKPNLYRGQRGPVTFATSIFGTENLLFLIMDQPELAQRFRDVILRAMLGLAEVMDQEAGWTTDCDWGRGFGFADDNCALLTPDMYELFGYPILEAIFERYAPRPTDQRFQHSDSDMGHLLPILGRLNFTGVNFGPNIRVRHIREYMPKAVINGTLAPFTLSRDHHEGIVREAMRDFDEAREDKGLVFATAGSINNGSRLTGMRLIMSAIQHFGQY
jgi:uroporphyrinogen decarboxylase